MVEVKQGKDEWGKKVGRNTLKGAITHMGKERRKQRRSDLMKRE